MLSTDRFKVKGWKKNVTSSANQKNAGVAISYVKQRRFQNKKTHSLWKYKRWFWIQLVFQWSVWKKRFIHSLNTGANWNCLGLKSKEMDFSWLLSQGSPQGRRMQSSFSNCCQQRKAMLRVQSHGDNKLKICFMVLWSSDSTPGYKHTRNVYICVRKNMD